MRLRWMGLIALLAFGLIPASEAWAQGSPPPGCEAFLAEGALEVTTDPSVLDNFRLPIFRWPQCPGVESYQVFLNGQFLASIEGDQTTEYQPTEELSFGSYTGYVAAVINQEPFNGRTIPFRIGIGPPTDLQPNHVEDIGTWDLRPEFSWRGVGGAMGYEVLLFRQGFPDGQQICDMQLDNPEGRGGAQVKSYSCQLPDDDSLEPGEQFNWLVIAYTVVDGTRTNPVPSERALVKVRQLTPPTNVSVPNGFGTTVRPGAPTGINLEWTHELLDAGEDVELQMYFISPENEAGTPNLDLDRPMTPEEIENLTTWADDENQLDPGNRFRWYVVARKEGQEQIGEVWSFVLNEPFGLGIGVKLGMNTARTSNDLANLRFMPSGALYVDQRIFRAGAFTLKLQLDLLFEGRSFFFAREDNPQYLVDDTILNQFIFAPSLFVKPMLNFQGTPITLYGLVGAETSFALYSALVNSESSEKLDNNESQVFNFNLVFAAGLAFNFDVMWIGGRNLELGLEFRYTQGITAMLSTDFLGSVPSQLNEFQLFVTNRLIDF